MGINASELTGLADLIAKIPFNTILTVSVSDSTLQNTLGLSQYGVLFILKLNDNRNFAEYYDVLGNFYWATNHSNGLNGWFPVATQQKLFNATNVTGQNLNEIKSPGIFIGYNMENLPIPGAGYIVNFTNQVDGKNSMNQYIIPAEPWRGSMPIYFRLCNLNTDEWTEFTAIS